jgi:4-hydroxy-L-threonine phosphate dehydrogenase PdxA
MSTITPHKLGVHKILKHIPLNAIFDAPSKRRLAKAVNIADLRLCAKARAHKVSFVSLSKHYISVLSMQWMC